jgi:hypothetical protein
VPGGIRTPNHLIRSQKLYPVELQALLEFPISIADFRFGEIKSKIGNRKFKIPRVADGTRTRNNQNHNLGLYH